METPQSHAVSEHGAHVEFVDIGSVGFYFLISFIARYGCEIAEGWKKLPCVNEGSVFGCSNDGVWVVKGLAAKNEMEFQGVECVAQAG